MSKQVFAFRYTIFEVEAVIEDHRLIARQGMRTVVVPIDKVQHIYLFEGRDETQSELLITYPNRRGTLQRARLYSDRGEPGFATLVDHLLKARPQADIRHLSPTEAWKLVGAKPLGWLILPAMMAVGTMLLGLLFTPLFVHGLDEDHATITIAELAEGLQTRNIKLPGTLQTQRGLVDDPGTAWFALLPPKATPDTPVVVVVKISGQQRLDQALANPDGPHWGVIRDVWWEGLSARRRAKLSEAGVTLAPTIYLLDLYAEPQADLQIAGIILGLMLLITVITAWVLWRRRAVAPPQRPRLAGRA